MSNNKILLSENTSPNIKRLILMQRAGMELTPKQLERLNKTINMEHPQIKRQTSKIDDDSEFDDLLDEILKEMGYEDEEDILPTIDMEDIDDVSDEEMEQIIRDLEYAVGERDSYE
tara:strand:+ start:933 stop:1280 length:348 start_codon:yes stop_codon:yes gene_type:complete